jgi:hypothetical protein
VDNLFDACYAEPSARISMMYWFVILCLFLKLGKATVLAMVYIFPTFFSIATEMVDKSNNSQL